MKLTFLLVLVFSLASCNNDKSYNDNITTTLGYISEVKKEFVKEWPDNRTIKLIFHGHSVPAGCFKTPIVNTFDSYPFQVLRQLKDKYPFAVINAINTSIGGEITQKYKYGICKI
ncbi:MAG: hypothetical protein JJU28_07660 [Cyclobacteriaceae bacterium]|nr:hypothetical protein [Cyclobacteriaceae bacterium]